VVPPAFVVDEGLSVPLVQAAAVSISESARNADTNFFICFLHITIYGSFLSSEDNKKKQDFRMKTALSSTDIIAL
jgi:hypothetical protein